MIKQDETFWDWQKRRINKTDKHSNRTKEKIMKNQNLKTYKIYWNDLNDDAKRKFKDLYHENININPIAIIDIEEENERNKAICNECGKSVKPGSGRFINRVLDLNKYEDRLEMQKPFPEGGFICIECYDSKILSKCCNAPVRYLDCEVCRKIKQQCIWICIKCGAEHGKEHIIKIKKHKI